jgi:hypothetical protein
VVSYDACNTCRQVESSLAEGTGDSQEPARTRVDLPAPPTGQPAPAGQPGLEQNLPEKIETTELPGEEHCGCAGFWANGMQCAMQCGFVLQEDCAGLSSCNSGECRPEKVSNNMGKGIVPTTECM